MGAEDFCNTFSRNKKKRNLIDLNVVFFLQIVANLTACYNYCVEFLCSNSISKMHTFLQGPTCMLDLPEYF